MHGKQVLIALNLLILINLSSVIGIELKISASPQEGNCAKYVQNPDDPVLFINHARILKLDAKSDGDFEIVGNLACTRQKGSSNLEVKLKCESGGGSSDLSNAAAIIVMIAVKPAKQMMSSQIEYRYLKSLNVHEYLKPEVLETQKFDHNHHLNIWNVEIIGGGAKSDYTATASNQCITDAYPDNMIADHGLYFKKYSGADANKKQGWTRMYFDPDTIGEHITLKK